MQEPEPKKKRGRPKKKVEVIFEEVLPEKEKEKRPPAENNKSINPLQQLLSSLFREVADPHTSYLEKEYKKDLNQLNLILSEYLDSYIILGFKPNGKEVLMKKIKNERDSKALERLLQGLITGQISFE